MDRFNKRVEDITYKAQHMKDHLLLPIVDDSTGKLIESKDARNERLGAVTKNSIFESAGRAAGYIQATAASGLRDFCKQHRRPPSDELLASAFTAIQNVLELSSGSKKIGGVFESAAEMSTTEGVLMRDRLIALILPVMLNSVCGNIVSFIPGSYNQSEIFKIKRRAGSTFGDITKGDILKWNYNGQYSSMDQRHLAGTGDGSDTGSSHEFRITSTSKFGAVQPFKRKSIKVYHDHNLIAKDDGDGNLAGSLVINSTTVTVTGTVDYDNGVVDPIFSTAPANGIAIHLGFDIDIEKDPTLIPLVTTEMEAKVLYPHEAAIAADTTLQALWAIRRELNLNSETMSMTAMRNLLSADKDRKVLRDLYFFAKSEETWNKTAGDSAADIGFYWKGLLETLMSVDSTLLNNTGTSGLVGLVADTASCAIFKAMPAPYFVPAPGYKSVPQPHYVGTLFGMWELYCDPQGDSYSCLCYAKGQGIGEAGYVMGDAIPAMSFRHAMQRDLIYKSTLWELAYRDLQPFDGREYFTTLKITAA